jgi:hypothetical protein
MLEVVEHYADGARDADLATVFRDYYSAHMALNAVPGSQQAAEAIGQLGWNWRWRPRDRSSSHAGGAPEDAISPWQIYQVSRSAAEALAKTLAWNVAREAQADLLRDVLGNPFHPTECNPAWLAWNDGTVPKLAQAIYDERRFGDLPILADALEEAGCTDAAILDHCRGPGPHVRGCWVVDLLSERT